RTLVAFGRLTNGLQVLPPSVDFTITPAISPSTSNGSPTPRYKVSGFRPNATAPPLVLIRASVLASQRGLVWVKVVVFHSPPPEVSTYSVSGSVGWGKIVRMRPLSEICNVTPFV